MIIDCFLCDNCNAKLLEALDFQQSCIRVYKKNNPNYQQFTKSSKSQTSEIGSKQEDYYILQTSDEIFTNEEQTEHQNQLDDQYAIYEVNGCKEIQYEEQEKQSCSKDDSKIEGETLQECLVIEKQSEIDDSLMNEEILSLTIENDQNSSYKVESLDESQGNKKGRKSYTVQQKLEIIKYAEQNSNREAARKFGLNESTIRCFRRQKDMLQGMDPNKSTKR